MIKGMAIETVRQAQQLGTTAPGTVMNSASDLIARTRAGDQKAFQVIFERYSRPVISFIYDMVSERELAEELMQETFVRAYRNLAALREDARLSTWLFGIAKNVARASLRSSQKLSRKAELDDESVQELRDERPKPDDFLINNELNVVICDTRSRLN